MIRILANICLMSKKQVCANLYTISQATNLCLLMQNSALVYKCKLTHELCIINLCELKAYSSHKFCKFCALMQNLDLKICGIMQTYAEFCIQIRKILQNSAFACANLP